MTRRNTARAPVQMFLVSILLALAGCSTMPVPEPGQSAEEISKEIGGEYFQFMISDDDRQLMVTSYSDDADTRHALVFDSGRLVCRLWSGSIDSPDMDWEWVSQPDGAHYLAGRLFSLCGAGEDVPPRRIEEALSRESGLEPGMAQEADQGSPKESDSDSCADHPIYCGLGQTLFFTFGIVTAPIWGPPFVAWTGVAAIDVAGENKRRDKIHLGSTEEEVRRILGRPSVTFPLSAVSTSVLAYRPRGALEAFRGNWYVGIKDGVVHWVHVDDAWLDRMARMAKRREKDQK